MNIVAVEDEVALREEIVFHLQRDGHSVTGVGSAAALYRHLAIAPVDLIVLDLGLPDEDGLSVAAHVRALGCGLVMLTARSAMEDRIRGLQQGADAYLAKPVDFGLLLATIASVFRRLGAAPVAPVPFAEWRLDRANWRLHSPDGQAIPLTAKEASLLKMLFVAPGVAVDRRILMRSLQAGADDFDARRLEALVSRLRHKVLHHTPLQLPVKTVHGIGYAFVRGE
jgi:DNA-binding response OmpR family regulator